MNTTSHRTTEGLSCNAWGSLSAPDTLATLPKSKACPAGRASKQRENYALFIQPQSNDGLICKTCLHLQRPHLFVTTCEPLHSMFSVYDYLVLQCGAGHRLPPTWEKTQSLHIHVTFRQ